MHRHAPNHHFALGVFCGRFQLAMLTCLPRATLKAPGSVFFEIVEPPPTVPPAPIVTGAINTQLLPHVHIVFNDGAVFVGTVVIGRDAARPIVHALTQSGIAEISQVIGFGAFGQGGIFHFHKIAYVHFGA
jgi:hypothetical protein